MSKGKLRLTKDRGENREVDVDLRGFGQEKVFSQSFPHAFLSVRGVDTGLIKEACTVFGLETVPSSEKNATHLRFARRSEGEHTVHSVHLTSAALFITAKEKQASVFVGESSNLKYNLEQSFSGRESQTCAEDVASAHWLKNHLPGVTLGPSAQYHLKNAGVNIDVKGEDYTLDSFQTSDLKAQFVSAAKAAQAAPELKRKGG